MILICVGSADAQTKVGIILIAEDATDFYGLRPSAGLVIEHKATRKSGIESGIFYRTLRTSGSVFIENELGGTDRLTFNIRESNLTLPILYKFYTRIVDISVGPTLDLFLGWNQTSGSPGLEIDDYSVDPNFSFGGMLKISKSLRLSDTFFLEPDVRINPVFNRFETYGGIGLALKYQVKKK